MEVVPVPVPVPPSAAAAVETTPAAAAPPPAVEAVAPMSDDVNTIAQPLAAAEELPAAPIAEEPPAATTAEEPPAAPVTEEPPATPKAATSVISAPTGPISADMSEDEIRAQLQWVFNEFDADGSGEVSTSEMAAMADDLGMNLSASQLEEMMKEGDKDGSGEIGFEEFETIVKKQLSAGGSAGGLGSLFGAKAGSMLGWFGEIVSTPFKAAAPKPIDEPAESTAAAADTSVVTAAETTAIVVSTEDSGLRMTAHIVVRSKERTPTAAELRERAKFLTTSKFGDHRSVPRSTFHDQWSARNFFSAPRVVSAMRGGGHAPRGAASARPPPGPVVV